MRSSLDYFLFFFHFKLSREVIVPIELKMVQIQKRILPIPNLRKTEKIKPLDLRPSYMRGEGIAGILNATPERNPSLPKTDTHLNPDAHDLLFSDSKTLLAFDLLAQRINYNIDYPNLLIENGVQGVAILDLYFDSEGNVNEGHSTVTGDNGSVRGMLVKAARDGIVKWYQTDAFRLKKDEFKNQHFRTEFAMSYTQASESSLVKSAAGNYAITRRHYMHQCAVPGGVDIYCLAMKTYGAVNNLLTHESRILFEGLRDRLEHYDEIELKGINQLIRG